MPRHRDERLVGVEPSRRHRVAHQRRRGRGTGGPEASCRASRAEGRVLDGGGGGGTGARRGAAGGRRRYQALGRGESRPAPRLAGPRAARAGKARLQWRGGSLPGRAAFTRSAEGGVAPRPISPPGLSPARWYSAGELPGAPVRRSGPEETRCAQCSCERPEVLDRNSLLCAVLTKRRVYLFPSTESHSYRVYNYPIRV